MNFKADAGLKSEDGCQHAEQVRQQEKCKALLKELVETGALESYPSSRTSNLSSDDEQENINKHSRDNDIRFVDRRSSRRQVCDPSAGQTISSASSSSCECGSAGSSASSDDYDEERLALSPTRRRNANDPIHPQRNRRSKRTSEPNKKQNSWFLDDLADIAACAAPPFVSNFLSTTISTSKEEEAGEGIDSARSTKTSRRRVPVKREHVTYHVI